MNEFLSVAQDIRNLLAQDRLEDALSHLRAAVQHSHLLDKVVAQEGRFESLKKVLHSHTEHLEHTELEKNRIRSNLLELVKELEKKSKAQIQVYIGYSESHFSLAKTIHDQVEKEGFVAFLDKEDIQPGEDRIAASLASLRASDYFVLLLSEEANRNEILIKKVLEAKKLNTQHGKPTLIPIKINWGESIPLNPQLAGWLDRIQSLSWNGSKDTELVVHKLIQVMGKKESARITESVSPTEVDKFASTAANSDMHLNDIYEVQQSPEAIRLLAAQKQAYIEGKRYNSIFMIGSILLGFIVPILAIIMEDQQWVGIVGGVLGIGLTFPLTGWASKKIQIGATIQEEFDFLIYGWDWTDSPAGRKVPDFDKNRLSNNLKDWSNLKEGGKEGTKIIPWYNDYRKLPHSQAILSCQNENLYWDRTQKYKYANFLIGVGIAISIVASLVFIFSKFGPIDSVLKIFFPVGSVLIYLGVSIHKIQSTSRKLDQMVPLAQKLKETYSERGEAIPKKDLQEIQHTIYTLRKDGYPVPEWFFKKLAPFMDAIIKGNSSSS